MSQKIEEIKLLKKVVHDLEPYLPQLILVGGWAPYLYAHYLWKQPEHQPLKTMDIDFGVLKGAQKYNETIAQRVRKQNYGEHHLNMGKLNPFVPIVQIDGLKADVEFISPMNDAIEVQKWMVGQEIKVNEIIHFDVLLQDPISIMLDGLSLQVAAPSRFVFHKLLTFTQRMGDFKREKDLYYAFFVLLFHPEAFQLVKEVQKMIHTHSCGLEVEKNIKLYFEDPHDKGPAIVSKLCSGTFIERSFQDVKQTSFEKFSELI